MNLPVLWRIFLKISQQKNDKNGMISLRRKEKEKLKLFNFKLSPYPSQGIQNSQNEIKFGLTFESNNWREIVVISNFRLLQKLGKAFINPFVDAYLTVTPELFKSEELSIQKSASMAYNLYDACV